MSDKNLKPSEIGKVTDAVETILAQMKRLGLNRRDLIILIQDRTPSKVNRGTIVEVLDAIGKIEEQFTKAQEVDEEEHSQIKYNV